MCIICDTSIYSVKGLNNPILYYPMYKQRKPTMRKVTFSILKIPISNLFFAQCKLFITLNVVSAWGHLPSLVPIIGSWLYWITLMHSYNECCCFKVFFFFVILLFPSVVPQTTVILNSDRQNAIVAKMDDPLSNRAPDSLENIISKSVATTSSPPFTATATATVMSPLEDKSTFWLDISVLTWAKPKRHCPHFFVVWGLCHALDRGPIRWAG